MKMAMARTYSCFLPLLLLLPSCALGITRYVTLSNEGNINGCLGPTDCNSISAALVASDNGDVIQVSKATYVEDTLVVNKSLTLNFADSTFMCNGLSFSQTGLVANTTGTTVTVTELTVNGCDGGGIHVEGGAFVSLTRVTVHGCNSSGGGGGLAVSGAGSSVVGSEVILTENTADFGGGVHVFGGATVSLTTSTVRGNTAVGAMGAGGIYINHGLVSLFESSIVCNEAPANSAFVGVGCATRIENVVESYLELFVGSYVCGNPSAASQASSQCILTKSSDSSLCDRPNDITAVTPAVANEGDTVQIAIAGGPFSQATFGGFASLSIAGSDAVVPALGVGKHDVAIYSASSLYIGYTCDALTVEEGSTGYSCGESGLGSDCASGYCADGVCCATACDGLCDDCNVVGQEGTCVFAAAGTDPHGECSMVCGACSGVSASCSPLPVGTLSPTCSECEVCQGSSFSCMAKDCQGYACDNDVCAVACANDGDCALGYHCDEMFDCVEIQSSTSSSSSSSSSSSMSSSISTAESSSSFDGNGTNSVSLDGSSGTSLGSANVSALSSSTSSSSSSSTSTPLSSSSSSSSSSATAPAPSSTSNEDTVTEALGGLNQTPPPPPPAADDTWKYIVAGVGGGLFVLLSALVVLCCCLRSRRRRRQRAAAAAATAAAASPASPAPESSMQGSQVGRGGKGTKAGDGKKEPMTPLSPSTKNSKTLRESSSEGDVSESEDESKASSRSASSSPSESESKENSASSSASTSDDS